MAIYLLETYLRVWVALNLRIRYWFHILFHLKTYCQKHIFCIGFLYLLQHIPTLFLLVMRKYILGLYLKATYNKRSLHTN